MPDKYTHSGLVFLLCIPLFIIFLKLNWNFTYLIGMFVGAVIPDILDPPTDYTHRKFFHSKRVLKFLSTWGLGITFILGLVSYGFFWIFFGNIGYISHLLLDSTTPMGLPY